MLVVKPGDTETVSVTLGLALAWAWEETNEGWADWGTMNHNNTSSRHTSQH